MDASERAELEAAIVGHCQWLEQHGIAPPESPGRLEAWQVFELTKQVPADVQLNAPAILGSLVALCAFRTRDSLCERRQELRAVARKRLEETAPEERAAEARRFAMVRAATDDSHIVRMNPSLAALDERLRTAERTIGRYITDLKARHTEARRTVSKHLSVADIALARWMASACRRMRADLAFFRGQVQGREVFAHLGPTDGKAWHRLRGECLLQLKEARIKTAVVRALFPPVRPLSDQPDRRKRERELRTERDRKAIKRAKKRLKSAG